MYDVLDWVDLDTLDWGGLSANPHPGAIEMLMANCEKIDMVEMCANTNPDAVSYLRENVKQLRKIREDPWVDTITMRYKLTEINVRLRENVAAREVADMLEVDRSEYSRLEDPTEMEWIRQRVYGGERMSGAHWYSLCKNPHPEAMAMLREAARVANRPAGICCWLSLAANPSAEALFLEWPDKAKRYECYRYFARNPADWAVDLLFAYFAKNGKRRLGESDRLIVQEMCTNPNPRVLSFLSDDEVVPREFLKWRSLWANPGIFVERCMHMKNAKSIADDD